MVFTQAKPSRNTEQLELYHPEGLEPSRKNQRETNTTSILSQSRNANSISLLSIVIPAHNEEGSIAQTLLLISQLLDEERVPYEILVVNDNSRDRTEAIIKRN